MPRNHIALSFALMVFLLPAAAFGVDGVILIDQNKAMAGNVTPGDTPGFPVTISKPGSYRLDGNLTLPDVNTTAILVTADNVTIDLNGFSIIGPFTCPPTGCAQFVSSGIDAFSVPANNLTVSNGMISGINGIGINAGGSGTHIEKVHVSNSTRGIQLLSGSISDCIVQGNDVGIAVSTFDPSSAVATITNVAAISNQVGIYASNTRLTSSVIINSEIGLVIFDTFPDTYSGNLFIGNTVADAEGPYNTGQNVCGGVLCP